MRESLKEINDQKAEKFLNTFYFQYGHRSIADLAHIAFAIEKLSMIAAIILVDEQRWDGQERSTRYQDFRKSGYFTPDFGSDSAALALYQDTIKNLFGEYEAISCREVPGLQDAAVVGVFQLPGDPFGPALVGVSVTDEEVFAVVLVHGSIPLRLVVECSRVGYV